MNEQFIRAYAEVLSYAEYREGRDKYGKEIREIEESLEPHFEHEYPAELLKHQHPGEEEWAKLYREKRWTAVTTMASGRVYTTLQRISQADDWKIRINDKPAETGVIEDNSLKAYVIGGLPKYVTLSDWLFGPLLNTYLSDPNAVVVNMPDLDEWIKDPQKGASSIQMAAPYPHIYEAENVVYKRFDSIALKLDKYKTSDGVEWDQFLVVTKDGFVLYRQVRAYKEGEDVFDKLTFEYRSPIYPVQDIGNIIYEIENGLPIYDSILKPCLPAWNEVLYRHSDLIVNWAMHGNPIKWQVSGQRCKTCKGVGKVLNPKDNTFNKVCSDCNGTGSSNGSPFGVVEINIQQPNATNPNVPNIPTPPVGYATRDTESLKAQQEDIDKNIYRGFQAIGLELLANVPAAQSGIAKQYDRKEINTFFYQVAVHLAKIYKETAMILYAQRLVQLGVWAEGTMFSTEKFYRAEPEITVPTDFDILTAEMISDQLDKARKGNFNPIIIRGLEYDLAEKIHGAESMQIKLMKAIQALDPLVNKTVDEKTLLKDSGAITTLDFVLSTYLESFINQLMEKDENWLDLDRKTQREQLKVLATEKESEVKTAFVPIVVQ